MYITWGKIAQRRPRRFRLRGSGHGEDGVSPEPPPKHGKAVGVPISAASSAPVLSLAGSTKYSSTRALSSRTASRREPRWRAITCQRRRRHNLNRCGLCTKTAPARPTSRQPPPTVRSRPRDRHGRSRPQSPTRCGYRLTFPSAGRRLWASSTAGRTLASSRRPTARCFG